MANLRHSTEAAKIGGVGLQIIRDWVLRFNARGADGLLDGKAPGRPSKLNAGQRQAVAGMIERGPIPAIHGVRWRLIDLAQWIFEEFAVSLPSALDTSSPGVLLFFAAASFSGAGSALVLEERRKRPAEMSEIRRPVRGRLRISVLVSVEP